MKKNIIILIVVIALIMSSLISGCSEGTSMSQEEMKQFILEQRNHESIFSDEIVGLLHSTESTVEILALDGELSGYGEYHIYVKDDLIAGGVIKLF